MKENIKPVEVMIIDYDVGNTKSVENAFRSIAGVTTVVTDDRKLLEKADCLVLPGVGAFKDAMESLERKNLIGVLSDLVVSKKKPLLAICVGMQILFEKSEEGGSCMGLGWLKGEVVKFDVDSSINIPHFGWNDIEVKSKQPLLEAGESEMNFYFAHSYHAKTTVENTYAVCKYGYDFPAVVGCDNIVGTQFHPEKSHRLGLQLIRNFVTKVREEGSVNA